MGGYKGEYRSAIARAKRVLIAAGLPWSVTTGRYSPFGGTQKTTPGVRVTRVGCSETITLHVHGGPNGAWYGGTKEAHFEFQRRAIETLRAAGLPFDDRGWLACGRDALRG